VSAAIDQKALDVCALDLQGVSDIADFFVIASGTSQKHVQGIGDRIRERLKSKGESTLSVSGQERGDWVVLDFASVVVHLFHEPIRQFYDLDGLWKEASRLSLPENLEEHAKRLRTGMYSYGPCVNT
jgi:ribosome-associated protein